MLVEYIGDTTKAFDDPTQGEALSNKMYDDGACIIYHAAGDSGNGLFKAAAEQQLIAIGVDSDQYEVVSAEQAQWIMTSMIKRVDTAVYDAIVAVSDGTFEGGTAQVFGLAERGHLVLDVEPRADGAGHHRPGRGVQAADPRR